MLSSDNFFNFSRLLKKNNLSLHVTNQSNRGLISENRSSKATLIRTIPRSCLSRLHRIYLKKFQILIELAPHWFFSNSGHSDTGTTDVVLFLFA